MKKKFQKKISIILLGTIISTSINSTVVSFAAEDLISLEVPDIIENNNITEHTIFDESSSIYEKDFLIEESDSNEKSARYTPKHAAKSGFSDIWKLISGLILLGQNYEYIKDTFLNTIRYEFRVYVEKTKIYTWDKSTWVGKSGVSSTYVKKVQKLLNLALPGSTKITEDGVYGPKTKAKIQEFQRKNYLSEDGICGRDTYKALLKLKDQ